MSKILQKFSLALSLRESSLIRMNAIICLCQIPRLYSHFISNQRNNSFSTLLYKNFLELSHHERRASCVCFNSGWRSPFSLDASYKPRVEKFPNDNSFSVKPRRRMCEADGYKSAPASSRGNLRARIRARVRIVRLHTHADEKWEGVGGRKRERQEERTEKGINHAHRDYMTREPGRFSSLLREDDAVESHVRASGFSRKSS